MQEYLPSINEALTTATPEEIILYAYEKFGDGLVVATSFGADSLVTLNMVTTTLPIKIPVWFGNTGYHFPETLTHADRVTKLLGLNLHVITPKQSTEEFEAEYGELWKTDMPAYHWHRKVKPMAQALQSFGIRALISGVRREQTPTRAKMQPIEFRDGVFRIHPLLNYTESHVEQYLRMHDDLPRHPLADQFGSIGDMHSSGKTRADRHFGNDEKKECGFHLPFHLPLPVETKSDFTI